ncbi:MAG: FixH family protein [Bacteroidetes bacterium]|nr:FixH family protein [Bacteroidota bacterium]MBK9801092.1 FixH family protein [Bacteroidota bacterium]MBP6413188.1 FixH family protein [Bacteroidia bacterium]
MNWGKKIAILYIGFICMIGLLVYKSSAERVDLVSPDYYAQELKFQDKINQMNNMNLISGKLEYQAKNNIITINYPKSWQEFPATGEIKFYRPSNSKLDFSTSLKIDSTGVQQIQNAQFERGIYTMQIGFTQQGKKYYMEQQVFMN